MYRVPQVSDTTYYPASTGEVASSEEKSAVWAWAILGLLVVGACVLNASGGKR